MTRLGRLLLLLTLAIASSTPAWAEVKVGTTTISPETPALYVSHIKFLTVPPDKQADPKFTDPDIAKIKTLEDPLRREIYDKLAAVTGETFAFATIAEAQQLWLMRLTIIDDMNKMNSKAIKFYYHRSDDPAKAVSPGSAKWTNGDPTWWFFVVKPGEGSYDAIKDLIASTVYGECAGAISTCVLDGAATALGKTAFDALHPAGTLGVGWQPSVRKHRYEAIDTATLVPGDYVYFANKADYGAKCKARGYNGYWQGENCVVMGGGKFAGLGAFAPDGSSALTAAQMRTELKTAYEKDTETKFTGDPATEIRLTGLKRIRLKP